MSPSSLFANILKKNNKAAQSRTQTAAPATAPAPAPAPAHNKRIMSITQTYFLAHKARGKLSTEASRADHNLRLLVGHANLLDSLMLELADAEREQESWFNQSLRGAADTTQQDRRMQWDDTDDEPGADWHAEDADSSDSDSDMDVDVDEDEDEDEDDYGDVEMADVAVKASAEQDDDEDDEDDAHAYAHLTLTRSPSHATSPPELDLDSDSSEDEAMPPSPPVAALQAFSEKQKQESMASSGYYDAQQDKDAFYDEGFYLPPRNPARIITAISVY